MVEKTAARRERRAADTAASRRSLDHLVGAREKHGGPREPRQKHLVNCRHSASRNARSLTSRQLRVMADHLAGQHQDRCRTRFCAARFPARNEPL